MRYVLVIIPISHSSVLLEQSLKISNFKQLKPPKCRATAAAGQWLAIHKHLIFHLTNRYIFSNLLPNETLTFREFAFGVRTESPKAS